MQKKSKWRRALALVLATAMMSQNCMITSIGGDTVSTEAAQSEAAAQAESERQAAEAAAAQEEAERQAAEAAAQAESERQAAEEAANAESERQAAEEAAKAESERQAAEEAAKAESESQAAEEAAKNEQQDDQTEEKNEEDMTPQLSDQTSAVPVEKPETEGQTEDEQKPEKDEPVKNEEAKDPGKTETEKEDVFYRVTFDSQAAVHGTIQADGASVGEDAVSSYYKDVKENDPYTFTVVPDEDYEIEYVRADQTDIPGTGNENEYRIANVTKDTVITVTYKEIPQDETSEGEDGEDVRKNVVTFQSDEGASVTVNGTDVTNGTGEAEDGKIVFAVVPAEGYQVTSVLVDGSIEARTTGNENEYIVEGIQTDETIVSVSTEWIGNENESEAETEIETETEAESEIEIETEAEVETEAEDEISMPAQTLTASANGIQVTVSAEKGVLPEGTSVRVTPLSADSYKDVAEEQSAAEGKEIVDLVAIDVTLYDKDGNEIQPQGGVSVTFSNIKSSEASESISVYHMDGQDAEKVAEVSAETDTVGFQAEHFSPFLIKNEISIYSESDIALQDESDTEIYTVTVYQTQGNNSTRISSSQYEAGTEYRIEVPVIAGYTVTPKDADDNNLPIQEGYVIGTVDSDISIFMVLEADTVNYVVKHRLQNVDRNGYDDPVAGSDYYEIKQGTTDSDTEAEIKSITGFTPQAFVQTTIAGDGSTVVEIFYDRNQISLSYDSAGGTYINRQFTYYGTEVTVSTTEPEKTGYSFDGWYDDNNQKVNGGTTLILTEDTTLTARWTGETVSYQIVYFQEQNDGTYKAVETRTGLRATAGTEVTITEGSRYAESDRYDYYHFGKSDTQTLEGDGSTSINVYYDLNVYTLRFTLTGGGNSNAASHMRFTNGKGDGATDTVYSFTARLGDNILSQWPADEDITSYTSGRTTYYWYSWTNPAGGAAYRSKRDILEKEMIPWNYVDTNNAILNFSVNETTNDEATNTVTYKLQTIEAALAGTIIKNNTNFRTEDILTTKATGPMDQKALFGFEMISNYEEVTDPEYFFGSLVDCSSQTFYYRRHVYKLQLMNNDTLMSTYNVPYQASLANYLSEPDRPSDVPDYYEWKGWYSNPQGAGDPVDVDTATMPGFADNGSTYILYGVWGPKDIKVTFDLQGGTVADGGSIPVQTIKAGETAAEPQEMLEKVGYDFDGWWYELPKDGMRGRTISF